MAALTPPPQPPTTDTLTEFPTALSLIHSTYPSIFTLTHLDLTILNTLLALCSILILIIDALPLTSSTGI
jgi:hypothetical protein